MDRPSFFSTVQRKRSAPKPKHATSRFISAATSRAPSRQGFLAQAIIALPRRRFVSCRMGSRKSSLVMMARLSLTGCSCTSCRRKLQCCGAPRLADDAYGAFRAAVRPGMRQFELVAAVEHYLRSRGCPDNFMILGSGGKDVLGMTPPSERAIASGDLVTTELTPAIEGYFVQICRTLVVGNASDAQRHAFAIFREALEAGIAAVRPGASAADVARAENDVFRKYGLGEYTSSKWTRVRGHGLGLFCDSKPHLLEDVGTPLAP